MGKQESEKTVTGSDGSGRYERKALIDKLYETQELSCRNICLKRREPCGSANTEKPFISEDSLNAAIIAETTVIIVESAAGIRMRSVTV